MKLLPSKVAVMTAFLSLIAAIAAALIARSVMTSNHRQAWINGLREDLAAFFTEIDLISQAQRAAHRMRSEQHTTKLC